ncbi:MAG TPA: ABC transporter permease, partial [Pirellulales bacterium]
MVLETDPLPLSQWLAEALPTWLAVVGAVAFVWLLLGFLISTLKNGPGKAGDNLFKLLVAAASDLGSMSPRRVFALAQLAVKESWRKRVFAALGVYLVILAFAIWFLDPRSHDPAPLYLSFVLTATTYLILIMSLFLSAFSLPADIKSHTIYTIVTKPVRSSEIVLGRILGFAFVGTVMLATMGLFSYLFVVRGLSHTHELSLSNLKVTKVSAGEGEQAAGEELSGFTEAQHGHRHEVVIGSDGVGRTDVAQGHWHEVTSSGEGANRRLIVGEPQGQFHARVPLYGALSFKDRSGLPTTKGINVGNEWTYRSYIDGGTRASATWKFEGLDAADYPDG